MEVIIKAGTGRRIKFDVRSKEEHLQRHWIAGNFYEAHSNGLLAYLFRNEYKKQRCLDIGASIGNHALYFSKVLDCTVTAIEPSVESFKHLKHNVELNNAAVKLHNVALGDRDGFVSMRSFSGKKENVGMKQVVAGNDVRLCKLDDVVKGQFGFIKIDVENYNIPLLKGAAETLKRQRKCHVFIECETPRMLSETSRIMTSYGYRRHQLTLNHTPTYLYTK
jgi:FkbM family methyltransferase